MNDYMITLWRMAYLYCSHCTQQEEKFISFKQIHGFNWLWEDCQAAYQIVLESSGDNFYNTKYSLKMQGVFSPHHYDSIEYK